MAVERVDYYSDDEYQFVLMQQEREECRAYEEYINQEVEQHINSEYEAQVNNKVLEGK